MWELSSVILCFLYSFLKNTMFQFLSRAAEEGENHSNVRKNTLRLGVVCYVGEVLFKDMCLVAQLCLFATPWTVAHQAFLSMDFPGKNTGVGCYLFLQWIFPTQGSNEPPALASRFFTTDPLLVQFSSVQLLSRV